MSDFFRLYGDKLLQAIATHLVYVLISVFIGFVIALFLGILLSRAPKISKFVLPVLSVVQTIPGIVFIGILFLYLGMVPATVLAALSIYAIFPVLKNTYTGLIGVSEQYKEAAKGCGMSSLQSLLRVELPLALPAIIGGLRMSTVYIVSWAVLASMIGLGGLGDFIYIGVSTNNNMLIIAGAIPAAILAVGLGLLIDYFQKKAVPKGLRGDVK
ncbi:ABC transporter permease [Clostridium sp. KNHs216]|uniref:ABC transporter permease n=1 Tax=Clostridium sp. KNHs216 TaxID=1550235 RepID=UPI00114D98F6|nr:ABC transporter permease [Clostridium sp. KNHs216]TQI67709.1 osmoprotectant transport system permease protein [Clostridium sp. KNHs216]